MIESVFFFYPSFPVRFSTCPTTWWDPWARSKRVAVAQSLLVLCIFSTLCVYAVLCFLPLFGILMNWTHFLKWQLRVNWMNTSCEWTLFANEHVLRMNTFNELNTFFLNWMTTLRKSNNICSLRKVVIPRNVSFDLHPAAFLRIWHSIKSNRKKSDLLTEHQTLLQFSLFYVVLEKL